MPPAATMDRLPEALQVPGLSYKTAAVAPSVVFVQSDPDTEKAAPEGVVTAIVSVTGVIDEVGDLILPGAYKDTLGRRRPKVIDGHDWAKPIGRVLHAEEWMPGDPRLPKETKDGKPWPAEAGAVVATMQFNLKSVLGQQAFEAVRFYSETNECEYSIGYIVPPGGGRTDKKGIRHITRLDCFEFSPVLFGAAPLSMTLDIKSAVAEGRMATEDEVIEALHLGATDEIDWSEVDGAVAALEGKAAPGPVVRKPSDVLRQVEAKANGGADQNRGNAEKLRHWYVYGGGAAKIRWGEDGDFMRCVKIAAKHMDPERAKGYCNLRHQDATGAAPGHAPGESKDARTALGVGEPTTLDGLESKAGGVEVGAPLAESMNPGRLPGTYEDRLESVRRAVTEALMGPVIDDEGRRQWSYVSIEGTWADRLIATRCDWRAEPERRESFEIRYGWADDGDGDGPDSVVLGAMTPVRLQVSYVTDDGDKEEEAQDYSVHAFAEPLERVATEVKAALGLETKAGRVLSGANEARLRQAVEHLIEVLRAAGVRVGENRSEYDTTGSTPVGGVTPDTTSPTVNAAETKGLGDGMVTLDPADLAAGLALLGDEVLGD